MRCGALRWGSDSGGAEAARAANAAWRAPPCAGTRRRAFAALLAMPKGMLVLDVNIVHAPAVCVSSRGTVATGSSADVDGAAAAIGEKGQGGRVPPATSMAGAYEWVPVVMESGGKLGKDSMRVLKQARDDRGPSPTGWRSMCFVRPRARGAQCSACARQRVCVEAGVAGDGPMAAAVASKTGLDRPTEEVG